MGKATLASALGVLALTSTASADATRDWVVLKISRARVAPAKADGTPWDPPKAAEPNGCRLLGADAVLGPAGGAIAMFLCPAAGTPQAQHDPRAPDLFVQVAVGGTKFRTPVAPDTVSAELDFPIAIPLEAIPPAGIELQVEDLDQDVNAGELIGAVKLTKQQVQAALSSSTRVLTLSDDRVQGLELEVRPYDAPSDAQRFSFAVNQNPGATPVKARAGEVVTITAQGKYSVRRNKEPIDPNGHRNSANSGDNRTPDFKRSNHGGAIAYVGSPEETHAALFVGSCVSAVTPVPGPIHVGVNDTDVGNNTGDVEISINVSLPTVEQWRAGGRVPCPKPAEPVLGNPRAPTGSIEQIKLPALTPETVLSRIQSTYMAGVTRCYKTYLKKDSNARGRITLALTIDETGRTLKGAAAGFAGEVDDCITSQMLGWRFVPLKGPDIEATTASFSVTLQLVP
jgi:hypothetical protein